MAINITVKNTTVWSDHPDATEKQAHAVGEVFAEHWLKGYPMNERIRVEIEDIDFYIIRNTPNQ
jgi:hypothetical protein